MENEIKAPKNILLLGEKDLLKIALPKLKAKKVKEWKGKNFPLYKASAENGSIGISAYYYGASAAAVNLEDLVSAGAENFIFVSYSRPLAEEMKAGSIVLPTRSVRDEGTSFHYLKPAKQVIGNTSIEKGLLEELKKNSLKAKMGLTWTTDAPFSKVRKTSEIVNSKALVIDNDTAALFAVSRYRQINLGGILLVSEQSIRGRLKQKIKDPLKALKNHLIKIGAGMLVKKSFWENLSKEKEEEKKETQQEKTKPRQEKKTLWDDRVEELAIQIDVEIVKQTVQHKEEEVLLEALEVKKELFVGEYHRTRSKYIRGKISSLKYNKITIVCIDILEKILEEVREIGKPGNQAPEILAREDKAISEADVIAEQIYAQLAEGEDLDFLREIVPVKPHKNMVSVFLVNLPRRFRYKPYYKRFFDSDERIVEIPHQEFVEK